MSSTTDRSRKGPSQSEYYVDAFRGDLQWIWGETQFAGEIEEMCHYRALATSIKKGHKYVKDSRKLLFHYESEYSGADGTYLDVMYKQLPVSTSMVRKYVHQVATAYKWDPTRVFGTDGSENDTFAPIYEKYKINRAFRKAHRYARVVNCVGILPKAQGGKISVRLLTPDLFRVERAAPDSDDVTAVWYAATYTDDKGRNSVQLVRMDAREITWRDRSNPKRILKREPNKAGEITFTFLRLEEGDESFYGGGDHDLLEQRMESNDHRLKANTSIKYEGHSILIGTNLQNIEEEDAEEGELNLPPGSIVLRNGIGAGGEDAEDPPDIHSVAMQGQYLAIDELRKNREKGALRSKGLPNSNIDDEPGAPVSGAARRIEREELNDVKEEDIEQLMVTEQEFKRKLALVINAAGGVMVDGKLYAGLPVNDTLSIEYTREPIIMEPKDEFELMMQQYDKDLIPVTELVWEFGKLGKKPDIDEAITYLRKNRAMRKRAEADTDNQVTAAVTGNALQESVGGSAQIAALQQLYTDGKLTREMVIANAMVVFKYSRDAADALFPELPEKTVETPPETGGTGAVAGDPTQEGINTPPEADTPQNPFTEE